MYTVSCKVPGGKLVRLRAAVEGNSIATAQLSGDFFLTPPEAVTKLETFLIGWDLSMPNGASQLARRLEKFLARERIQLAGASPETIGLLVQQVREARNIPERLDTREVS